MVDVLLLGFDASFMGIIGESGGADALSGLLDEVGWDDSVGSGDAIGFFVFFGGFGFVMAGGR